jgi:hypothetical protein
LIRERRSFFLAATLAALALRLFFFVYFPMLTDDSRTYADLATNWLQHGIYGQTAGGPQGVQTAIKIVPTDARLPGYPAFLAGIFWLFGPGNFRAAMLAQILVDLATCLIVADFARRVVSERAARIAFLLAALCPFLANYAVALLTETLEIFFTALALDCAAAGLNRMREGGAGTGAGKLWAATGAAIAACILLRPDGGILLAAVLLYLAAAAPKGAANFVQLAASLKRCPDTKLETRRLRPDTKLETRRPLPDTKLETRRHTEIAFFGKSLVAAVIVAVFALAPLAPWTVRNFRTLHHFQPLAPRYANETDELVLRGFNRWVKTWMVDYVSVEEIYWNVPGDKIDPEKLPSRAFDNPAERDATLAAIADYNQSQDMTPELDARFGNLAANRIRAHAVRYYVVLPVLRVADMWLRPRTEILPPDVRWWEFRDEAKWSAVAVGFGLLNLAYVAGAALALVREKSRRPPGICWAGLLVGFLLLRSAFLGTLENPEPRYTLEGYPAVIVLASSWLGRYGQRKPS